MIEIAAITVLAALFVDRQGFQRVTLRRGLRVYHGTCSDESWENDDIPMAPFWVSESPQVAEGFKTWHQDTEESECQRVLVYELTRDIEDLVVLHGLMEMKRWLAYIGLDPECWGAQEAAEATCDHAGGWIIEGNYPEGHDIMLCDTTALRLVP